MGAAEAIRAVMRPIARTRTSTITTGANAGVRLTLPDGPVNLNGLENRARDTAPHAVRFSIPGHFHAAGAERRMCRDAVGGRR